MHHQRQHLFPRAAVVGLGAGLVAAHFRAVLAGADTLRNGLIAWSQPFSLWGWIFRERTVNAPFLIATAFLIALAIAVVAWFKKSNGDEGDNGASRLRIARGRASSGPTSGEPAGKHQPFRYDEVA